MKNRMPGRAKKFSCEGQGVRSPRANGDNDCVSRNTISILEDNPFDAIVALIQREKLGAFT